jgi:hypothetical protein
MRKQWLYKVFHVCHGFACVCGVMAGDVRELTFCHWRGGSGRGGCVEAEIQVERVGYLQEWPRHISKSHILSI